MNERGAKRSQGRYNKGNKKTIVIVMIRIVVMILIAMTGYVSSVYWCIHHQICLVCDDSNCHDNDGSE